MTDLAALLQSARSEYDSAVCEASWIPNRARSKRREMQLVSAAASLSGLSQDRLITVLSKESRLDRRSRRALVSLANDYGAFMLRNALALAVVLEKEDGEIGF